MVEGLLLPHQQEQVRQLLAQLEACEAWSGTMPVLLYQRCWLKLEIVAVEKLAFVLPPDGSAEAPELVRYRALIEQGLTAFEAEQLCWDEFGRKACQEALRRFWRAQDRGNHGWTLERYLQLLADYRRRFGCESPRPLPLLVLARSGASEQHRIHWLRPSPTPMRHTCA